MDNYIIPPLPLTGSGQGSCSSKTWATSHDSDPSNLDLERVTDIVSERHSGEENEKEKDIEYGNRSESKEDKEDGKHENSNPEQDEISSRSKITSTNKPIGDSRKRTSKSASMDDCQGNTVEPNDLPSKKRPLLSESSDAGDSIHQSESSGLTINQLIKHVQKVKKKGLLTEYAHIRMEPHAGTFYHSRARNNLPKNRYTDVLCYDHSRVQLGQTADVPTADYINANFVDGYLQKNAYISTQGPLPNTFVDFWRMVWLNQCQVIVMTTRTLERQRIKCGQYWPSEEQSDVQFGEFVVSSSSVQSFDDYLETKLVLHNNSTGESREIRHLQFISWPDYGVPPPASFLDFLFHVRSVQEAATQKLDTWSGHPLGPPLVIHCSAGIGRTGTFITIDISLRRLEDIGTVDVPATVRRIRSQRAFSIQMPEQYVFCHLGIIEHAIRSGLVKDMESFVLENSDSDSD